MTLSGLPSCAEVFSASCHGRSGPTTDERRLLRSRASFVSRAEEADIVLASFGGCVLILRVVLLLDPLHQLRPKAEIQ